MMLITKEVEIKWSNPNKKWYTEKGYIFTKNRDKFIVKTEDLQKCSEIRIEVFCDYCLEEGIEHIISKSYKDYVVQKEKSPIKKDCCKKCLPKKNKESNLLVYGVENTAQLPKTREKFRQTSLERYGTIHPMKTEKYLEKMKNTCLEKYGTEYYMTSNDFKNKAKNTCKEKYNVNNYSETEEFKEKYKNTCQKKYGCNNTFQFEEFKEKTKETCLKKYGVENYRLTDKYKEQVKNTSLKKYGVEHYSQAEEVIDKKYKTNIERYGFENPMKNNEIKLKQMSSMYDNNNIRCSRQQKYICKLVNGELNYFIKDNNKFSFVDIALIDEKIYCEFDGSGHELSIIHEQKTEHEFKEYEKRRTYGLIKSGWKEIRIISKKDYLPSDEIIINMFDDAKILFNQGFHRIVFDIDNGTYKTSKFKDIYDYGKLYHTRYLEI